MSLTSRKGDDGFPEPAHSFMSALAKAGMQRFGEKPEVDAVPCQLHPLDRVVRCFPFWLQSEPDCSCTAHLPALAGISSQNMSCSVSSSKNQPKGKH